MPTVTDAKRAVLRQRLRVKINDNTVGSYTWDDQVLDDVLTEALLWHDTSLTYETLPVKEEYAVLLLSWVQVCYLNAGKNVDFVQVTTPEGGLDKSQRAKNWTELAYSLKEVYDKLCEDLGIGHGGEASLIQTGTLVRVNQLTDEVNPGSSNLPPAPVTLSNPAGITKTTADLSWSESPARDFFSYRVYQHTVAGLKDLTTLTTTGATYKGIVAAATLVTTIFRRHLVDYRVTGLTSGTTYYYVVVTEDRNGRIAVSNEVNATQS